MVKFGNECSQNQKHQFRKKLTTMLIICQILLKNQMMKSFLHQISRKLPLYCFKHAHVNKSYIQSRFLDRQHVDPAENCGYRGRNGPNSEKQGNIWPFGFIEG